MFSHSSRRLTRILHEADAVLDILRQSLVANPPDLVPITRTRVMPFTAKACNRWIVLRLAPFCVATMISLVPGRMAPRYGAMVK